MPRRDWKNEDFDQSIEAKGRKKMKIRVIGPGFVQEYPTQAACARGLKVSQSTVSQILASDDSNYGDIKVERIK